MKSLKITFFMLLTASTVWGQKPDQALIRVKYAFSHMLDTNNRQDFYTETMMLVAGKDASVFLSYDAMQKDLQAKKAIEEQIRAQNGNITSITMPKSTRSVNTISHYYFAGEDKFFTQERMGTIYEIEQKPDKINWRINNETVDLEGIKCKKATGNYKGRNWTVWFAEELPFVSGPWKLIGLPGLVLQAHDENKEIRYDFAGIEKVIENKAKPIDPSDKFAVPNMGNSGFLTESDIFLPTSRVVKTTVEELNRLKKARADDPQGFARAQLSSMGMGGIAPVISSTTNSTSTSNAPKKVIFNNPIDKTQKL